MSLSKHTKFCVVGGVSTGKSTFLNGAFCQKLTQCKIKRTTMVPTCYIENNEALDTTEYIYKTIESKNNSIIEKTENSSSILNPEDYAELIFNVGKLDINFIGESGYIAMYDIPGLNDARTKAYYYQYLDENFYKFNVIIMFVDIHSGLNTSDEMDMLNFIVTNTEYQKKKGRDIFTLIVVNKADDMTLEGENLSIRGELNEMFQQVEQTVTSSFKNKGIEKHLIGITPFCAMDAYLYRMIKKYPDYELSDEERIKIGINEMGKKFNKYGKARQIEEVKEILKKESFISDMISLSGFKQIETIINKFLKKNRKGFEMENVLYIIRSMRPISEAFTDKQLFSTRICEAIQEYITVYDKLKTIDEEQYHIYMKILMNSVLDEMNKIITNYIHLYSYKTLIEHNSNVIHDIMFIYFKPYFTDYYRIETEHIISLYPNGDKEATCRNSFTWFNNDIIEYTITSITTRLREGISITISEIVDIFKTIQQIGKFDKKHITYILNSGLLDNKRENTTINDFNNMERFISLVEIMRLADVDVKQLLRFVILNKIKNNHYGESSADELFILHMMYENKLTERPITNVLGMIRQNISTPPKFQLILEGFRKEYLEQEQFELDAYYLSLS
jgi:hypothetical protein